MPPHPCRFSVVARAATRSAASARTSPEVDAAQPGDVLLRQARQACAGAGHAGGYGADRVGVAAEIGADDGRLPGIARGDLEHGEGRRNRFLLSDAGADQIDDQPDGVLHAFCRAQAPAPMRCARRCRRRSSQCPRRRPGVAAATALVGSGSRQSPPAMPWLTAAATAAAEAMAIEVLCVARQVSATLATSARAAPPAS